jgi:integrase
MVANRLTASGVKGLREPGKYSDGNGLVLDVATPARRAWVFRYQRKGKARAMTLGSTDIMTLAQAREARDEAKRLLAQGVDPLDRRRVQDAGGVTFADAASRYIGAHTAGWRNPKHRQQWTNTIETYTHPVIGKLDVREVATRHVLEIVQPIWATKPETASRVRGRIETILAYAIAQGWREGPNPAIWRGHLQLMLPAKSKVHTVEHHAALPWREAPAFMAKLRERDGMGVLALQFAILTAARSGEARGATWAEIDVDTAVWTIPAKRMKAGREHRVPLSEPARAILDRMAQYQDGSGFIFLSQRFGTALSDMTLTAVLRRMGRGDLTAHGFRSTFRDWSTDTGQDDLATEAALAHAIGDKTRAAYERSDRFDLRRKLLDAWAAFMAEPAAENVVPLRPAPAGPLRKLRGAAAADGAARAPHGA